MMSIDDSGVNSSIFVQSVLPPGVIQPYFYPDANVTGIVVINGIVN
jgi:hypothetical protein